jgi:hypothetical protein
MNWMNEIANVLQNYSQNAPTDRDHETVANHFGQVAQAAPPSALADGLAAMFRSDQTPPFAQMIGQLFSNSNANQRANLLNTLLSSGAGADILSQLATSAGINLPAGLGSTAPVTPEMAEQIPPETVQEAAAHVETHDPSIVDRVSQIYAEHPRLVKTLGAAALTLAMAHLANRRPS